MDSPRFLSHSQDSFSFQKEIEQERKTMEAKKQERVMKEMKKVTKLIALASIFSFILSYSSLISSFQQRLHLLSMYSNLVDKKYMFLLCNGIVGFIVGNFETLSHDKASNKVEETKQVEIRAKTKSDMQKAVTLLGENNASNASKEEEEEERVTLLGGEEDDEEEVALVVKDVEGILVQDLAIMKIDDHDDVNDDLNKKCEEFIKKVKAEIRLESRKLVTL